MSHTDHPPVTDSVPGRYRIERELGRGGMATVYLARDLRHDRPVALKVLRPDVAATVGAERFEREVRVTAGLLHPHILPLLDSGTLETAPGRTAPFYVMPYVEGESLRDRLIRERQLPVEEAVRLASDIAAALAYAHAHGVVHRDIKPENVLLAGGQALVADFGIARGVSLASGDRLTETGIVLGTPQYMSPEQATGDHLVDGRADVYALGCVLYEMLAGDPPFTGPTAQAVVARSLANPPAPIRSLRPAVPRELERAILRALAKVPADRFAGAEEFSEALSQHPGARARADDVPRRRLGLVAVAVLVLAGAGALLLQHRPAPAVTGSASSIAVLPFAPSGTDTALERLGRDLVFTLSAALDGLGGIRVVDAHTVLALAPPGQLTGSAQGSALGRRLGAGSIVQGSLVRVGHNVRLDLRLLGADSAAAPLAGATVTTPADSVGAMTDSAARALVAQIWSRGRPPTPSLDGALRTRSVPALRAFLQGEGEIANGRWDAAAVSYARAMQADPTFWLAYARHVYAGYWSLQPVSDTILDALGRHRFELPERERLSSEAILLIARDSALAAIDRARMAAERHPDSWFGWLLYGDAVFHLGPVLGHAFGEARAPFERAVALNPVLIPAWEHLLLVAIQDEDTTAAASALRSLDRLRAWPSLSADGYGDRRRQFRLLHAIQGRDSAAVESLTDSLARDSAPAAVSDGSYYDPFRFGMFQRQIAVSRKALTAPLSPERRQVHRLLSMLSWGGRGAWDSVLASADRMAAGRGDSVAALAAYGLAVVGAWIGAVDTAEAIARRPAAIREARGAGTAGAELAWLDGVLAAAQGDRRRLAEARADLRRMEGRDRTALGRSLAAFQAASDGATRQAGESLAALEWEQAAVWAPDLALHPLAMPLHRMAAAGWLAETGNHAEAERLLHAMDAMSSPHPGTVYLLMMAGLADLERGRVADRLGRVELARKHYRRFLQRYDRPAERHLHLREEARRRLGEATE